MHRSQILSYVLISFLIGTAIGSYITFGDEYFWIAVGVGVLILGVSAYHRTFGQTPQGIMRRKIGFVIGMCIVVATGGAYRFQEVHTDRSRVTEFNDREVGGKGIPVRVEGYVAGDIDERGAQVQFPFQVRQIVTQKWIFSADERVLVIADRGSDYRYGDVLSIEGPARAPQNSETFDYEMYLKKQGIRSIFSSPAIANTASLSLGFAEHSDIKLHRILQAIKSRFEASITATIPEPEVSYIQGVLLGSRRDIPQELKDAFTTTGPSHILAISGYNITIVAEAVLAVLFFWFRRRKAIWIATAAIILFTILTGATASVVRAAVMGLLVLFASGYGRVYDAKHSIILAGAVMVFFNPFLLVFDVGFQLSFLAVIGLIYLYPILQRWFQRIHPLLGLKEIFLMTLAAQIMVAPLLIGYFHSLSIISLVVNILILPFVPFVMLFGFLAGTLGIIFVPLGKVIGFIAWALAHYQIWIVERFASFSLASISLTLPWGVIAALYGVLFLGLWQLYKRYGID
jgi:competence protein ComEC